MVTEKDWVNIKREKRCYENLKLNLKQNVVHHPSLW